MLANQEPEFMELSKELYKKHADESIRAQCRAREDAEARECTTKKIISDLTSENQALASQNESLSSQNELFKQLLADNHIAIPEDLK